MRYLANRPVTPEIDHGKVEVDLYILQNKDKIVQCYRRNRCAKVN